VGTLLAVGIVSLLRPCPGDAQDLNDRLQSTLDSLRTELGFPGEDREVDAGVSGGELRARS